MRVSIFKIITLRDYSHFPVMLQLLLRVFFEHQRDNDGKCTTIAFRKTLVRILVLEITTNKKLGNDFSYLR